MSDQENRVLRCINPIRLILTYLQRAEIRNMWAKTCQDSSKNKILV